MHPGSPGDCLERHMPAVQAGCGFCLPRIARQKCPESINLQRLRAPRPPHSINTTTTATKLYPHPTLIPFPPSSHTAADGDAADDRRPPRFAAELSAVLNPLFAGVRVCHRSRCPQESRPKGDGDAGRWGGWSW